MFSVSFSHDLAVVLSSPKLLGNGAGIGRRDTGTQPTADARANGNQLATDEAMTMKDN